MRAVYRNCVLKVLSDKYYTQHPWNNETKPGKQCAAGQVKGEILKKSSPSNEDGNNKKDIF